MSRFRPVPKSFHYAFDGVKEAFANEPNFRVHVIVSVIALAAGFFLNLNAQEWLILLLTVSSVIILELINTAIEALVDLASPKIHPRAKVAKDVAAAAVLTASIIAIVVGIVLFFPKILVFLSIFY